MKQAVSLLTFVIGATASMWLAFTAADRAQIPAPSLAVDAVAKIHEQYRLAGLHPAADYEVLLLCDSLCQGVGAAYATWLPNRLSEALNSTSPPEYTFDVASSVFSAVSLYTHYYMSDQIIGLQPDLVVLEFNLFDFSPWWLGRDRKQVSGWMPVSRWPEATRLSLFSTGLSADELIFYRALIKGGLLDTWQRLAFEQARLVDGYWTLAQSIQDRLGIPRGLAFRNQHKLDFITKRTMPGKRATPFYAEQLLGAAMEGVSPTHPVLRVFDALLERLRSAGIDVLVYVPPYNVDHLEKLGIFDAAGFDTTIREMSRVAKRHGAEFVRLDRLLPDTSFRDNMDHLVDVGPLAGIPQVATALAPLILRKAAERGRQGD